MNEEALLRYKVEQLQQDVAEVRQDNRALKDDLQAMKDHEAERERKFLVVGITTLGGIVTALFGVLWAYRGIIFK